MVTCLHRRSQEGAKGAMTPKNYSMSCRFVPRDVAVPQTKYCCLLKYKLFGPPKSLGYCSYATACSRGVRAI